MDHVSDKTTAAKMHAACDECRMPIFCMGIMGFCSNAQHQVRGRETDYPVVHEADTGTLDGRPIASDLAAAEESQLLNGNLVPQTDLSKVLDASDNGDIGAFSWDLPNVLSPGVGPASGWSSLCRSELSELPLAGESYTNTGPDGFPGAMEDPKSFSESILASQDPATDTAPCSCLKELYAMLESFQSLPPPSFPSSRAPLLKATSLARAAIRCPMCPQDYPSALQNLMLLNTLLPLVVHGYASLLRHIEEQAAQGCKMTFRVGDLSQSAAHLHTGTLDCPMGFNIELESEEWSAMARKVVKQDVYGNAQNMDSLSGVVEELEQRQHIWHILRPFDTYDSNAVCQYQRPEEDSGDSRLCLRMVNQSRQAIKALKV
ncbi:MAG: hypothetical protein Q9218_004701 [Villophora microphyllina]